MGATQQDQPPRRSLFIGRWQPLHDGHKALIQVALDEGREVAVAIMDTPHGPRNPFSFNERCEMFWKEWGPKSAQPEMIYGGRMRLLKLPWIDEVCYGRACGWECREIDLPEELKSVTGGAMRAEMQRQQTAENAESAENKKEAK